MELNIYKNIVIVPANTEIKFFVAQYNVSSNQEEINGFGLNILKNIYSVRVTLPMNKLSFQWLLFQPCERMKKFQNNQSNDSLLSNKHHVVLAFGSLVSPCEFKCAHQKFLYNASNSIICQLGVAKYNKNIHIIMGNSKFLLKSDHIDNQRGVIIDIKSKFKMVIHICLCGNLEEYVLQEHNNNWTRKFYLQKERNQPWQPCFSAMHLLIQSPQNNINSINNILHYFIRFFSSHSISIQFGSIQFSYENFIYQNETDILNNTFICQYAWHMLNDIGCRMHDQLAHNTAVHNSVVQLRNENDDEKFYYLMERLRRLALSGESYFLQINKELPIIVEHYEKFYLDSIFYQNDMKWITNYVRIPWFCLTPTRLIVKHFKFMRSNRVFRYFSNVSQCMAFVEFRDDDGSAYLSSNLSPFLKYYLEHGFHFGGRDYIYLHHAQSQIRHKQFYFYCEKEGGMTRQALEKWMGNFDDEKLPAKNTARRTQPFSSTEATIEIDRKLVHTIPDIKTGDGKYNFTDGVGQISSELNQQIHAALGIDAEDNNYISSVLQIRYGGCKGTIAVNPHLNGKQKQLLIRPSMNKFKSDHQMLELCKRSLRRRLCLNREVINLLSYRGISSERLMVYQLENVLWLITALVSNQSAVEVLNEKVLRRFPWSQIASYVQLSKEPFFRRLLHTTISNNLHQLVTRAHIRVPKGRYMFGVVDEFGVLNEGEVFVQITDDNGKRIVLRESIAITKNPCRHPGDLRVLRAVDHSSLHHLYDVLVFPQKGCRPHSSEISGSDLDGDEYTVIYDPNLIPRSSNPTPFNYDSGPAPKPLNRVVTRNDRIKVILDICEQDNLGRLCNIHLILCDLYGIDSEQAISLAGSLSEELDSVKSGQHPYTVQEIMQINKEIGRKRPDFMQTFGYQEYQSNKILGKLFRSAHHLNDVFSKVFPSNINDSVYLDRIFLHDDYENYLDSAQNLYYEYQQEMWEIISSYGFTNEIDLFCCVESRNVSGNDRSDIQQTLKILLQEVFQYIREQFHDNDQLVVNPISKAAACYYVAYTDTNSKNKQMLSFPWLFSSQLLVPCSSISEDDEVNNYMEAKIDIQSPLYRWLIENDQFRFSPHQKVYNWTLTNLFKKYFEIACNQKNEMTISLAEMLIEQIIEWSKITEPD